MSEPIKSVEEFIEWTRQLDGQMLLYRGLADANWEVRSSAYRRIENSLNGKPTLATFQNYIKQLLDNAGLQGLRYQHGRKLSDLELLAELQHYGAATCLIDFTKNALVALWFACREESKKDGKVVAMATDDIRTFSTVSYEDLNEPIEKFLNPGVLWKWTPSSQNNRMVSQQSVFVFGEELMYEILYGYQIIRIGADSKKNILVTLEKSFGVNEQHLFNDLLGFALSNAHEKKYNENTPESYFRLGLKFQQQRKFEKAKGYFTQALERDPEFVEAYYNRGVAEGDLGQYKEAITDFTEALSLKPDFAKAYYNRGVNQAKLGYLEKAIANYTEALRLKPDYVKAYINRGVIQTKLDNFKEAIADFTEALRLKPDYATAYYNRGIAKQKLSDHLGAQKDLAKAREIDPNF